jgi:hypothetical protein
MPSSPHTRSSIKPALTWVFLISVALAAVGMFITQRSYIQRHLPLMASERAAAEKQGAAMLEEIGTPAGAQLQTPVQQRLVLGDRGSMWSDQAVGVEWTSFWDAPGDHPQIDAWYHDQLLAKGWQLFPREVPSTVQTEYWKDKWLLTVEHEATFATDRPPHARFRLRLKWDYWHRLGRQRTWWD